MIDEAKDLYHKKLTNSLNDTGVGAKKYWSVINRLMNKRKIPRIPPIRFNNEVVSDTLKKADLFNNYIAEKCTVIDTNSVLPEQRVMTDSTIGHVDFDPDKILAIIRSLNENKAHGWDNVSVRMIRICDDTLVIPLLSIFRCSLESSIFPTSWKMSNVSPCHKKAEKYLVDHYRPVSLLPIFRKNYEMFI